MPEGQSSTSSTFGPGTPRQQAEATRTTADATTGPLGETEAFGAGPGVSATTIAIGAPYPVRSAAANAAVGAPGIEDGDVKAAYQILIDDINHRGGVLGRKLVPVWYPIDETANETTSQLEQEFCSAFTEDHHVLAVFGMGAHPVVSQCMEKAGTVMINENTSGTDRDLYRRHPSYVEIGTLSLDRAARATVDGLARQKYFVPWDATLGRAAAGRTKVGVITYDSPPYVRALQRSLLPALQAAGHIPDPSDIIRIGEPQQTSGMAREAAEVANAVLKLRNDGVEHVIILEASGELTLEFVTAAHNQHYLPRYGFNSQNAPQALVDAGDIPAADLVGSQGIGWWPVLDLPWGTNPESGPYSNTGRRRCQSLMESHGLSFSSSSPLLIALALCDGLYLLRDALALSGVPNLSGFVSGVNRLGSTFEDGLTFRSYLSASQHDGVRLVRPWDYDQRCGCMGYTGSSYAVP